MFLLRVAPNKQQQAAQDDQGSGSCTGTRGARRSGILGGGDQLRHLSVQTDSSHRQITHQLHENSEKSFLSKPGLSLFMQSGLVQGDAKATTDQQNVNNTHATLRGCLSSAPLSIHNLSWYLQLGNSRVGSLFRAVFDSLVKKSTDLDLFEHQNNLTGNPAITLKVLRVFLITLTFLNPR